MMRGQGGEDEENEKDFLSSETRKRLRDDRSPRASGG